MKITAKIKLLPTKEQADLLLATLHRANECANWLSAEAWKIKVFSYFALQKPLYHPARERFKLTAQLTVRVFSKVADAYKLDKKYQRVFRSTGAIAYDDRILSFRKESHVNIWTLGGRQNIAYSAGPRQIEQLKQRQGESDLIYHRGKWYLGATCNVEEPAMREVDEWLGLDLGIAKIATDSDGGTYSGDTVKGVRHRHRRLRSKLQSKGTRGCRRKLRRQTARRTCTFLLLLLAVTGLLVFVVGVSISGFRLRKVDSRVASRYLHLLQKSIESGVHAKERFLGGCIRESIVIGGEPDKDDVLLPAIHLPFIHHLERVGDQKWTSNIHGIVVISLPPSLYSLLQVKHWLSRVSVDHKCVSDNISEARRDSATVAYGHRNDLLRKVELRIPDCYVGSLRKMNGLFRRVGGSRSRIGSISVGSIDSTSIESVDNQKDDSNKFRDKFGNIPSIALFFAGCSVVWVGWWNLHFRDGIALWLCCIVIGIAIALWGGWNWLIVSHDKPVPQVSNRAVTGLVWMFSSVQIVKAVTKSGLVSSSRIGEKNTELRFSRIAENIVILQYPKVVGDHSFSFDVLEPRFNSLTTQCLRGSDRFSKHARSSQDRVISALRRYRLGLAKGKLLDVFWEWAGNRDIGEPKTAGHLNIASRSLAAIEENYNSLPAISFCKFRRRNIKYSQPSPLLIPKGFLGALRGLIEVPLRCTERSLGDSLLRGDGAGIVSLSLGDGFPSKPQLTPSVIGVGSCDKNQQHRTHSFYALGPVCLFLCALALACGVVYSWARSFDGGWRLLHIPAGVIMMVAAFGCIHLGLRLLGE